MGAGVAWIVAAMLWWLVVGALTHDQQRRAPLSARAWAGYGLYAVGTVAAVHGIALAEDESGWAGVGLALVIAVAAVAAGFAVVLVVVRAVRRHRAGVPR